MRPSVIFTCYWQMSAMKMYQPEKNICHVHCNLILIIFQAASNWPLSVSARIKPKKPPISCAPCIQRRIGTARIRFYRQTACITSADASSSWEPMQKQKNHLQEHWIPINNWTTSFQSVQRNWVLD